MHAGPVASARILSRVFLHTASRPFNARNTVTCDTPATCASLRVEMLTCFSLHVITSILGDSPALPEVMTVT